MNDCLIVDDSLVVRRIARAIITDLSFEVREAGNGRQAFELCTVSMPDIILLDWQLPVMGAHDFMKALRLYGPAKWPHIIYCTTELDFMDLQVARAGGAIDVLLKPYDRGTLTEKFLGFSGVQAMRQLAITPPESPWPAEQLDRIPAPA